jgi:hypothetical protein
MMNRSRVLAISAGLIGAAGWVGSPAWIGTAAAVEPPAPPKVAPAAATFDLFTASEAATWNTPQPRGVDEFRTRELREDGAAPTCRSAPDNEAENPAIRILAPALDKPLAAPIDINLQFVPTTNAPIRPDTFRVCYLGLVTMDITKRVTDRVAVSAQGIHVTGANLPSGRHKLLLIVADERGRLARSEADLYIQ